MITYINKIVRMPIGRDIKIEKANFFNNVVPSWLILPNRTTFANNGITTYGENVIKTCDFTVEDTEVVEFEIGNLKFDSETPVASVVLTNGIKSVGIYTDGNTNYCKYIDGEEEIFSDDKVGKKPNFSIGVLSVPSHSRYAKRPKNFGLIIMPNQGELYVTINDKPTYSKFDLDTLNIDFSGDWHFELTNNGSISCSSITLCIEQNY